MCAVFACFLQVCIMARVYFLNLYCIYLCIVSGWFLILYVYDVRACISRFEDCPSCGADIVKIEPDDNLQGVVDRFIEGHARIKRSVNLDKGEEAVENDKPVIYEDVSLERGSFLVQQAMRVSMFFPNVNVDEVLYMKD